jgi:hypothetical protein
MIIRFYKGIRFAFIYAILMTIERTRARIRFGIPYRILWIDIGLFLLYPLVSPYLVSRRYMNRIGSNEEMTFGETPLITLEKICQRAEIPANAVIFDLGCGWGRTTFFLHAHNRAHLTIGIDIVPKFISRAEKLRRWMRKESIVFLEADFRSINYKDADVIWLYGTCFKEDTIQELVERWESQLKEGAIIITTSYSLVPYTKGRIKLIDHDDFNFIWGNCGVFIHAVDTPAPWRRT